MKSSGVSIAREDRITPYDREIHDAVATLASVGNEYINPSMIFQLISGSSGNTNISSETRKDILRSLDKMMATLVTIDASAEVSSNMITKTTGGYKGPLIPAERVEITVLNGNETRDCIHLFRTPPLYDYARDKNQIGTIDVLYFSLEQSRYELVTKGLARLTAQMNMANALSAIEIRNGTKSEELIKAIEVYMIYGEHEIIYECGFDTTIEMIIGKVQSYIEDIGVKPIVIVDYLQIIRPLDIRQSTKDAVDGHVRAFKKLQVENDLVVLLISSLNRSNYLTPVDYESFKESGGIEYTADVIWGLQLSVMNDEMFDKEAKLKQKREAVKAAKKAIPRQVELVCLKNRYGVSSYTCKFNYYAQYDYFVPREESDTVGQRREALSF